MQETIVLYAAPGIGHIVSMVELANHLLHLSLSTYSITILLTTGHLDHPSIDDYIRRISSSNPSISFLRLPPIPVPADHSVSPAARAFLFIRSNVSNVAAALRRISESSAIKAFVIDLFCTTAMETASSMGIPVYYFFTSGAAILAFFAYFPKIHEQSNESFRDMAGVELHVPGNSPLLATHVPEPMLVREDPAYWEMLYFCENLPKAKGILVNTFPELEPRAVKAVTEGVCFPDPQRAPPVFYVGPLVAEPQQSDSDAGRNKNKECLKWLDSQPTRSVLFLCFGSRGTFSVSQLKDIAQGLEKSKQMFLWVIKTPTPDERTKQIRHTTDKEPDFDLGSVLPNGFIERTKDRGLVVKLWAPQVEVLSHDSVGGFVTHCGWNSVLESVVAGVPMIAWPLYAEQHVNRHVMVDDMKVAVAVEQREPDGYVSEEEVEKRVRELMESEKGKELRETSLKTKQFAVNAVSEFGSSSKALANFVQTWIGITNGERI